MIHIKTTSKSVDEVTRALETVVPAHKFGLLHMHDLKKTMNDKSVDFAPECRVFEVCNPHHAAAVLEEDIRVNMALPCRISVWEEDGETKVGTLLPTQLLGVFGDSQTLMQTAAEVETTMLAIIEEVI